MSKFKSIAEVCKILKLLNPKTNKPLNHVLRFWEKEIDQIRPKKINNRRYYTKRDIEILRIVKILIKDQKITIKGVKKILNTEIKKLDVNNTYSLKNETQKSIIKDKTKKILERLNNLKNYGKKIPH